MGQRKLHYRRVEPTLNPKLVSKSFLSIFKEEIMAAISEGRFPGITLIYDPPKKQQKR